MSEAEILLGEREVELSRGKVRLRELTFRDSLRLERHIAPIVDALRELARRGIDDPAEVLRAVTDHDEALLALLEASSGRPREWIASLSDADGNALLMAWWGLHADFFTRRLVTVEAMRIAAEAQEQERSSLN